MINNTAPLETYRVTGPWGQIDVCVSPVDEIGYKRSDEEKARVATRLAWDDGRIGPGVRSVAPVSVD